VDLNIFNLLALLFFAINLSAEGLSESQINSRWCAEFGGQIEFRTSYKTYVDCLTKQYAVEAEFDYNWKESIGQSLHYAEATGRKAAILFIHRKESNKNYLLELQNVIEAYNLPIKIFEIDQQVN